MSAEELVGVWRLVSYVDLDASGEPTEGPLGPDPTGLLIYQAGGHMSVSMMRGDHRTAPADATHFMGYAGTWRLDAGQVRHAVSVSAHAFQAGTELVRDWELTGDLLTLRGTAVLAGRAQPRVLTWQRLGPAGSPRPQHHAVEETHS